MTLTVRDAIGATNTVTSTVAIANVAPVVQPFHGATILAGETFEGGHTVFSDPGADTWTAVIDYGDGSAPESFALTGRAAPLRHTYVRSGSFTVSVTVTDKDGGSGSATGTVIVLSPHHTTALLVTDVQSMVSDGSLRAGISTELQAVLRSVTRDVDAGNATRARADLIGFIGLVKIAHIFDRITPASAARLTATAQRLARTI